ncbi:MAG TPA: FAD-dependent oxidoreductase [Gemmatimonadales bacterium]
MITADLLSRIALFSKVPEDERASLAARAADIRVQKDELVVGEGQTPHFYGVLEGNIDVLKETAGREERIFVYGQGDFFGEVPLLLGAPVFADLRAAEASRLLRLEGNDFLQLISQCPVLSSEVTKTLVARVNRISQFRTEHSNIACTVVGNANDPVCGDLRSFLSQNRVAFAWQEQDTGGVSVLLADGTRLENPDVRRLAGSLGIQTEPRYREYDVVIVGGGAAGLAAAVYGASEGLRTLLLERRFLGGQAGSSSRIENYLGFPNGLSGDDLAERARRQALRFGAELVLTRTVHRVELGNPEAEEPAHTVVLDDGSGIRAKTVVLATGVDWRHLSVPGVDRLVHYGVYYGVAKAEATRWQGRTVYLVGGGNSAGQAAMLLSEYADSVTMLVRGPSLAASMSQYLVDRLYKQDNVRIETRVEVTGVEGQDQLEAIEVRLDESRRKERRPCDALFVLIGGAPQTAWLPPAVIRDQWGYVCTGRDVMDLLPERAAGTWPLERDPFLLETSVPHMLAAGDVRHGSIKRCAAAVGEGSMSIALAHLCLAEIGKPAATT